MSGPPPPPHRLEPTIDGQRKQQPQRYSPAVGSGPHRNAPVSSTSGLRLRLPPPLPPVKGVRPLSGQTDLSGVSATYHPPIGRLAPLHTTEESSKTEGVRKGSPPPRPPSGAVPQHSGDLPPMDRSGDGGVSGVDSTSNYHAPVNPLLTQPESQDYSKKTPLFTLSSSARSRKAVTDQTGARGGAPKAVSAGGETAEKLCPLRTHVGPVERFFVECRPDEIVENIDRGVEVDEDELLFDRLAEYTDDDSFFSSSSSVLEEDPRRLQKDSLRGRAVHNVYETLNLRALTHGRMPQELEDMKRDNAGWMYQVHQRAIALHHSSFFIFPPGMTARVIVYNIMHHWLMELLIILLILGYSIFTACWARHTTTNLEKPDFVIFADVFYTFIYGIEILVRMFASGFILHPRAFFRSPWHWLDAVVFVLMIMNCTSWKFLWNFTAFRLIRVIKACTYLPMPIRIKLLSKALLRSTKKLFYVSVILAYALFFFALLGLQLFRGAFHHRCVNSITGVATSQFCRPNATGQFWLDPGQICSSGFLCVKDSFPNPHYNFRSFDDIGHALLSTFQIMTFQGWTSLLQETNNTVSRVAILYYIFTIVFCVWFIPGLYVGVFIEKIEKTSRLFVQKQLQLFDSMLVEQRQRMNKAVKLRDFVERSEGGTLQPSVIDEMGNQTYSSPNGIGGDDIIEESSAPSVTTEGDMVGNAGSAIKRRTKWTNEQRVQLHLSLTRQRDLAEPCERKRQVTFNSHQDNRGNESGGKGVSSISVNQCRIEGGKFALGGRVGLVQHHPLTHTIGAAHGTDLPLAVRLQNERERLQFLASYQQLDGSEMGSQSQHTGVVSELRKSRGDNSNNTNVIAHSSHASLMRRNVHYAEEAAAGILATRESAGVIPNRYFTPPVGTAGSLSARNSNLLSEAHKSGSEAPRPQEMLIQDPEGGDFRYTRTCAQRWTIIRNILHMFAEGYPRILTQYLWEHRQMQRRFGLLPLDYVNKYEDAAIRKLRQRRALRDQSIYQNTPEGEFNDDDDYSEMEANIDGASAKPYVGRLSPIRMAKNIVENTPVTIFNGILIFLVFVNGVFNASRHYGQPDYWDEVLFISGVCFTSLFTLEIIIRVVALGPGPFFFNLFNILCLIVTIIGFFELGFARSNSITVLNWVQFLRVFRVAPFTPMRRVTRVLLLGFQDIIYALIFFSIFMFMWILLGMSFFGSRTGLLNRTGDDYSTRGYFDTFSHASFAVSQAFSYDRDEWLYMSWDGMRARGAYTILYFIAVVGVAFIFRFMFIAVFAWAWQREEELEEHALQLTNTDDAHKHRGPRLRWFDFSVWRSFKHIHGGFQRRDVAPDEVFHLNQDMRRQLRLAEAKERLSRQAVPQRRFSTDLQQLSSVGLCSTVDEKISTGPPVIMVPQFVNVGGQLQRLMNMPNVFDEGRSLLSNPQISQFQAENAQLRFARNYSSVPATALVAPTSNERDVTQLPLFSLSTSNVMGGLRNTPFFAETAQTHPLVPFHQHEGLPLNTPLSHTETSSTVERRSSVTGHFATLGYERPTARNNEEAVEETGNVPGQDVRTGQDGEENITPDGVIFEHVLFPGPRFRFKHVMAGRRHRVFERCLDCNTHKQMPLRAPPNVEQRTADELHVEHCHMAAVRSSRQLVLNTVMGYVRLQKELGESPTREAVETVLGQAWSCGMLLFETIEYLSCADIEVREHRTWDRTLEALQLQQWLIGLHVGEEQVGRATLAYILAHQKRQRREVTYKSFQRSWRERSFFIFLPDNPFRMKVTQLVDSMWFEWFIIAVIFAASICLCFYTPFESSTTSNKYEILHSLDAIFAGIFALEMLLKWISMGVVLDINVAYFWYRWNIFDCFITIVSLLTIVPTYSHLRYLKVMRCFRILGPLRHCAFNKELSRLALTMWNCIPMLANILLLFLLNYIVWAILAVRLFMGLTHSCSDGAINNRMECTTSGNSWNSKQRNFDNFYESLLTMVEVSTGSKWLDVIYAGVDGWSMNNSPSANQYPFKGFFFIAYYYISHFVLFSFCVASLIYSYLLAKNAVEGVAGITFEHQLWIRMQRMILRLKPRVQLLPLGNGFSHLLHRVVTHYAFELVMAVVLLFNLITMSLYWYQNDPTQEEVLDTLQHVWVALFTLELLMRVTAHGMRVFSRWSFCFGVFVTCLSYVQIGLNTTLNYKLPFNVNVLRLLHFGRLLKLVDILPLRHHLHLLHEVLLLSAPALVNVTLILMLAVFVFAVLGMHLIGRVIPNSGSFIDGKYHNFVTFPNALMMTFRLTTLEDWVTMLRSSVTDGNRCTLSTCNTTDWAPVFYVPIVICFALMICSLYVAVIVDNYVTVVRMNGSVKRIQDLRRFCALWSARDPNATLVLRTKHLPELLEALRPPLGLSSRRNRLELLRLLREYDIPDHGGKVHYYDVLLPLARRVLAMAFSEDDVNDGATFELVWRLSENFLCSLPTMMTHRGHSTAAKHFAASYVQAAYRRDNACRLMHKLRTDIWHEGRLVCDELGLPYENYGFGSMSLDAEDPRLEAARRGLSVETIEDGGMSAVPPRDPSLSPTVGTEVTDDASMPAARLPGHYQPAVKNEEKRFGPDVPNAVRRHETRSDKLRRKEEERKYHAPTDTTASAPVGQRSPSQRGHGSEYQPPLGTDPSEWLNSEMNRPISGNAMAASHTSGTPPTTGNLASLQQGTLPPR